MPISLPELELSSRALEEGPRSGTVTEAGILVSRSCSGSHRLPTKNCGQVSACGGAEWTPLWRFIITRPSPAPLRHPPHAISQTCIQHFPHPVCYFSPPSPHTCDALSLDHPPSCLPPPTDASKPGLKVISSTKPSPDSGSPYSSAHCVMHGLLLLAQCTVSSCPHIGLPNRL